MVKKTEREQVWVSLTTGEVIETNAEAIEFYKTGHDLQIKFRYRYNDGEWTPWKYGIPWEH